MEKKDLLENQEALSSQSEETFLSQANEGEENETQSGFDIPQNVEKIEISPEEVQQNINSQKKKIDEVEQSVSKQNTKKSKIINIVFFIINIAVVSGILVYQLTNEEWVPISGLRINVPALLVMILLLALVVLMETLSISYLLKQSTGKWRMGTSYKVAQIGRYYDSVTPMSSGGQPFQISYLKSRGVPLHTALSVPLAKYVFTQLGWVLISLVSLIVSWVDKSYGTFVSITSIIGFVLSFAVLAITVFLSCCKTVGKKLVVRVLKILYKIKIIKNYDKQYEKITKYISEFQDVMKQYAKSPKDFIVMTIICLLRQFFNYAIPFFIVKFFTPGIGGEMFFKLMVMTVLVDLASSFFPLPGGTGMNEISFTAAFGAVVGQSNLLVWVLILWRACSYYFYLVQGVCLISYDMAYGNRKYKWQVRKNYLAEESAVFKQEQINRFRSARAKRRKTKNKNGVREYL
jgi:uncharacterized protein (TIRG00374 family)